MIKLTRENEAITSFQHFEIWGFILTMRNVNISTSLMVEGKGFGFILTMRNVNLIIKNVKKKRVKVLY